MARASTVGCSRCGEWPHSSTHLGRVRVRARVGVGVRVGVRVTIGQSKGRRIVSAPPTRQARISFHMKSQ